MPEGRRDQTPTTWRLFFVEIKEIQSRLRFDFLQTGRKRSYGARVLFFAQRDIDLTSANAHPPLSANEPAEQCGAAVSKGCGEIQQNKTHTQVAAFICHQQLLTGAPLCATRHLETCLENLNDMMFIQDRFQPETCKWVEN